MLAQCDLPETYTGNTGVNMTLMLLPDFISTLPVTDSDAYVVVLTQSGMVVGSICVASSCLDDLGQTSIAAWGDETFTTEVDGLGSDEIMEFQLVDGDNLYDITPQFGMGNNVFVPQAIATLTGSIVDFNCFVEQNGCTDETACNFESGANTNDGTCVFATGCESCTGETDGTGTIIDNDDDGDSVCNADEIEGCTDDTACNYDATPTTDTDNDLCIYAVDIDECAICSGETDGSGTIVNGDADNDGICNDDEIYGCTDSQAFNFNPLANNDNGSCEDIVYGCTNPLAENYNPSANTDDPSNPCDVSLIGCGVTGACNYQEGVNNDISLCVFVPQYHSCDTIDLDQNIFEDGGCEFDINENGVCDQQDVYGCTESSDFNYNPIATFYYNASMNAELEDYFASGFSFNVNIDTVCSVFNNQLNVCSDFETSAIIYEINNFSVYECIPFSTGCMNPLGCNYLPENNTDDGSCEYPQTYYDCDGFCINDYDVDNVCDELEVLGCANLDAANYDSSATDDDGSCVIIDGCMDENYAEYTEEASYQPVNACLTEIIIIEGCDKANACNYNPLVTVSNDNLCEYPVTYYDCGGLCYYDDDGDGVCNVYEVEGCTDPSACNYDPDATEDDESCENLNFGFDCNGACLGGLIDGICNVNVIDGCADQNACNYNEDVNIHIGDSTYCDYPYEIYFDCDGFCINDTDGDSICDEIEVGGCLDTLSSNYRPNSTDDDGSCIIDIGCTIESAYNYNPRVLPENGNDQLCIPTVYGCLDSTYVQFHVSVPANTDDQSCSTPVQEIYVGCMDPIASNYDPYYNTDDGSCNYVGCIDPFYFNFNPLASIPSIDSCGVLIVEGCTDITFLEYNENANKNLPSGQEGSCASYPYEGCMNPAYVEYSEFYTVEPFGSCVNETENGCIDPMADNYNPIANADDGSCIFVGCMDSNYSEYWNQGYVAQYSQPWSCIEEVEFGCMNPIADNYESIANVNYENPLNLEDNPCVFSVEQTDIFWDVESSTTGSNMSIIIPSDVVISGDFSNSNPIPPGSLLGVFYYDQNNSSGSSLYCGGQIEYLSDNLSYGLIVIGDDAITTSMQEGFQIGDFLEWRLRTPQGLVYNITPFYNLNYAFTQSPGNTFNQNDTKEIDLLQLNYSGQVDIVGCMNEEFEDYNPFATVSSYGGIDDGSPIVDTDGDGVDDDGIYDWNEDGIANTGCFVLSLEGCMDDGSIEYDYDGDGLPAFNYETYYTIDDGSCYPVIEGCMDDGSESYNDNGGVYDSDGFYDYDGDGLPAYNYISRNENIYVDVNTHNSDKCIPIIKGCTKPFDDFDNPYYNYIPLTGVQTIDVNTPKDIFNNISGQIIPDGIEDCYPQILGCTDPEAYNFNNHNAQQPFQPGSSQNPFVKINTEDGSCVPKIYGCMDPSAKNYNPIANRPKNYTQTYYQDTELTFYGVIYDICYPVIQGCTDPVADSYIPPTSNNSTMVDVNTPNVDKCIYLNIEGCTNPLSFNFDPIAQINISQGEVGACIPSFYGCTVDTSFNYNDYDGDDNLDYYPSTNNLFVDVNSDYPGACVPVIEGCMDSTSFNFIPLIGNKFIDVNTGDDSCYPVNTGCMDIVAVNYIPISNPLDYLNNVNTDDGSCYYNSGCTNSQFLEYWTDSIGSTGVQSLPDFDDSTCQNPVVFYCTNDWYLEYYQYNPVYDSLNPGNFPSPNNIACNEEAILYCNNPNSISYYPKGDVAEGTSLTLLTGNFAENNLMCDTTQIVTYCNDPDYKEFYIPHFNVDSGAHSLNGGNIISNQFDCETIIDLYCDNPEQIGYYGINEFLEYEIDSINSGNVIDQLQCIEDTIKYCNEPTSISYYQTQNVIDGLSSEIANIIDNSICESEEVDFYCSDSTQLGYYDLVANETDLSLVQNTGTIINNDLICDTAVVGYCSNIAYIEHYEVVEDLYATDGNLKVDSLCNTLIVFGCMDPLMFSYDSLANLDLIGYEDGASNCTPVTEGCLDDGVTNDYLGDGIKSFNYNDYDFNGTENILVGDSSIDINTHNDLMCVEIITGCLNDVTAFNYGNFVDENYLTYAPNAILGEYVHLIGNTDIDVNTDVLPNTMDLTTYAPGSCYEVIYGCMDSTAFNYNDYTGFDNDGIPDGMPDDETGNPLFDVNTEDGSCYDVIEGCMDDGVSNDYNGDGFPAFNYVSPIGNVYYDINTHNDSLCIPKIFGCMNPSAVNFYPDANTSTNTCINLVMGCIDNGEAWVDTLDNLSGEYLEFGDGKDDDYQWDTGTGPNEEFTTPDNLPAFNYSPNATLNIGCIPIIYGCLSPNAFNFSPNANTNAPADNSAACIAVNLGCMDETAFNYVSPTGNPLFDVNTEDGSCYDVIEGCMDDGVSNDYNGDGFPAFNYVSPIGNVHLDINTHDNTDCVPIITGCTNSSAFNYSYYANTDNNSCIPVIFGCINSSAINYYPEANVSDNSCIASILGCTDNGQLFENNLYNPTGEPNTDELSDGLDDDWQYDYLNGPNNDTLPAANYNPNANTDDGSCNPLIYGCTNSNAINYNINATVNNYSCIPNVAGCIDNGEQFLDEIDNLTGELGEDGIDDDYQWDFGTGPGEEEIAPDGSAALNYNPQANVNNASCIELVLGCKNLSSINYNDNATQSDGSCIPSVEGCTDNGEPFLDEIDNLTGELGDDGIDDDYQWDIGTGPEEAGFTADGQQALNFNPIANVNNDASCIPFIYGCMNENAINYNEYATISNQSCIPQVEGCIDNGQLYEDYLNNETGEYLEGGDGLDDDYQYDIGTEPNSLFTPDGQQALNYNPLANIDDQSCLSLVYGCMAVGALNWNEFATFPTANCIMPFNGCTDNGEPFLDAIDNVTGEYLEEGDGLDDDYQWDFGTGPGEEAITPDNLMALNYFMQATVNDGGCIPFVFGCMNSNAINYNLDATIADGSCFPKIEGCTDNGEVYVDPGDDLSNIPYSVDNYQWDLGTGPGPGEEAITPDGFPSANFNPFANENNGSCIDAIVGCTAPAMSNYCEDCNYNDPSLCIPFIYGCMDETAFNYNPEANTQATSSEDITDPCAPVIEGCIYSIFCNYNPEANTFDNSCLFSGDPNCPEGAQTPPTVIDYRILSQACIDPIANNYDPYLDNITPDNPFWDSSPWNCDYNPSTCSLYLNAYSADITNEICIYVEGCMDDGTSEYDYDSDGLPAIGYNSSAVIEDNSCITPIFGCIYPEFVEYNPDANTDDGSCYPNEPVVGTLKVFGCNDINMFNYDPDVTILGVDEINNLTGSLGSDNFADEDDQGEIINPCEEVVFGCNDPNYVEYYESYDTPLDPIPNTPLFNTTADIPENLSCVELVIPGCTDNSFVNYYDQDPLTMFITDPDPIPNIDNGDCVDPLIIGCTNSLYIEYDSENTANGIVINDETVDLCLTFSMPGCTDIGYLEYNSEYNIDTDPSSCNTIAYPGCTDPTYIEYWSHVNFVITEPQNIPNQPNGTCSELIVEGCGLVEADNYYLDNENGNPNVNVFDNDQCEGITGCMNINAIMCAEPTSGNFIIDVLGCYHPLAVVSGDCTGCTNQEAINYNDWADIDDGTCDVVGCMDSLAANYNVAATIENYNC